MVQLPCKVEGLDGQLEVRRDRVILTRRGITALIHHGFKPAKEVPIGSIASIDFKEAGRFTPGYVIFHLAGNTQKTQANNDMGLKFRYKENQIFKELKEEIFVLINNGRRS